ncbi:STAS domain-containing protein [Micromonospora costi]|uniref:STAS domain-containing protein n=1 Tax=Micromonospora costi TaxID=1530042 RepID=A0A3A9ZVG2_9ACTN|nr:STAS domain-containing protein [Micromonospora costi]
MTSLSITSMIRSAGVVTLILRGSVGRADVGALRSALGDALRLHRPERLEVDMSGLLEIDPGVTGMVTAIILDASGGTFIRIVRAPTAVRHQLRLSGGDDLLG